MAPVEASCDKRRTLSSKKPSTMAMRAEWRGAEGMSPTSTGMGLGGNGETIEFYHHACSGNVLEDTRLCAIGRFVPEREMSFELRAWSGELRASSLERPPTSVIIPVRSGRSHSRLASSK